MLDQADLANMSDQAETWEKVARKLRTRTMPPAGRPRPDQATYQSVVSWLETELDRAAAANPNPGRTESLHRLNRAEYRNAVRDLLALEHLDIGILLPPDDASYGFDNIAGVLGMSPTLMERYVTAARKISQLAIGDPEVPPTSDTYRLPVDLAQEARVEGLPFGTRGGIRIQRQFPVDGEYQIKFDYAPAAGRASGEKSQIEVLVDGERVQLFDILPTKRGIAASGYEEEGSTQQLRVPMKAGPHDVGVTFLKKSSAEVEEMLQPYLRPPGASLFGLTRIGSYNAPYIRWVTISGPFVVTGSSTTAARRRIFVCEPARLADEAPCARRILSTLAHRAYRRPVTDHHMQVLESFYAKGREDGDFDKGIAVALEYLLASPDFLFRVERNPANVAPRTAHRISDVELASRLSFFLWSSIPDDELLDVAERGKLHEPAEFEHQTARMLADDRSQALVDNFAGQWLHLRNIPAVAPDGEMFPNFDENLRRAFQRETELFFASIMREDRSVLDLLRADYTFLNERLARHYGIPGIYGNEFRRVALDNRRIGGLLGQGSILTELSSSTRTSPVKRGKWIMENILGTPPPEAPPNVPDLKATAADGKPLSMREAMEQHRKNPVCASCHRMMDPLGFALEQFDAVGRWRTVSEAGTPIDATGTMPSGTKFNGVVELQEALLQHPDDFVRTVTERLLTYALGRGVDDHDGPAIRAIVREAVKNDYRFSSLILAVVKSTPFQLRTSTDDN